MKKKFVLAICILFVLGSGLFVYNNTYNGYMFFQKSINPKELNALIKNDNNAVIYIGKNTCSDCLNLFSKIKKILQNQNIETFYLDANKNRDEDLFKSVLQKLEVEMVPTILIIKNGVVEQKLEFEEINKY